jgi:hypothetical protein
MQSSGQKTCKSGLPEINLIKKKNTMEMWIEYIWFRKGTSAGICAHDSGFLGST